MAAAGAGHNRAFEVQRHDDYVAFFAHFNQGFQRFFGEDFVVQRLRAHAVFFGFGFGDFQLVDGNLLAVFRVGNHADGLLDFFRQAAGWRWLRG